MSGDLKERIETLLRSLGQTPDDVADSLRARGITGVPESGIDCPIANLLKEEIPEARDADWSHPDDPWLVTHNCVTTSAGPVHTPAAVDEFITVFDDGDPDSDEADRPYWDLEELG